MDKIYIFQIVNKITQSKKSNQNSNELKSIPILEHLIYEKKKKFRYFVCTEHLKNIFHI